MFKKIEIKDFDINKIYNMTSFPKELLIEMLSYSGLFPQPRIEFSVESWAGHYGIFVCVIQGIRGHKFRVKYFDDQDSFETGIRDAISLRFPDLYQKYMSVENNALILLPADRAHDWTLQTHPYIFPLDVYGDMIKNEFKKIAKEYGIE